MLSVLLALAAIEEFPYQVDIHTAGQDFEMIGRAQFETKVDDDSGRVTKSFRYQSSDKDIMTRQIEVFDRDGRLQSSLTGQTLSGEKEDVRELEKIGGKWLLQENGKAMKDDFPATITDLSVLWWITTHPKDNTKIRIQRFLGGDAKIDELNAIFKGTDERGHLVERWMAGFKEKTWYSSEGRVLRMEITHEPDDSVLIYRLSSD